MEDWKDGRKDSKTGLREKEIGFGEFGSLESLYTVPTTTMAMHSGTDDTTGTCDGTHDGSRVPDRMVSAWTETISPIPK